MLVHQKYKGEGALAEAIRELLSAPHDLRSAEAKIEQAKSAGVKGADLALVEEMLAEHKAAHPSSLVPSYRGRARTAISKKAAPAKKAPVPRRLNKVPTEPHLPGKSRAKTVTAEKAPAKKATGFSAHSKKAPR